MAKKRSEHGAFHVDDAAHEGRVVAALKREVEKRATRSPKWPALERKTVKAAKSCAACARRESLQVHHIEPFHLRPELELESSNLIVLCMAIGSPECHLRVGHAGSFKSSNPNVRNDAAEALANPKKMVEIQRRILALRKG